MLYNLKRRYNYLNYLSPNNFEIRYYEDIEKEEALATDLVSMKQEALPLSFSKPKEKRQ